ncbi:aspartyl-tRNA amidotransferase subunit B [Aquisalinus flavus]|uniref:Aspartyl-tRNA amidotransferase subunit B n=2 Tax=Aquisalinus flavus TaxID=1526572 RepID=A0A8J2V5S5_9PROT|nr:GatB/YqeY domain-containing protein [Aquisalinus flavus]GGD10303.1 aspartyl-tRNA amidotransferase subunit B [Aquisalinus flavus]
MLCEQINLALKTSMKERAPKVRIGTLRLINAALKDRDIAARSEDRCGGLTDEEVLGILTKMVKQREDAAQTYEDAGRIELAEQERSEIEVIREFLPRQLTEAEIDTAVEAVIEELDAEGLKDMGKCMGVLKSKYAGSMDFGTAGGKLKKHLAS